MGRMVRTSIPIHFQHTSIVLEILKKKNRTLLDISRFQASELNTGITTKRASYLPDLRTND